MSPLELVLLILLAVLISASVVLAIAWERLRSERSRVASILGASEKELVPAARGAAEAVVKAGEMAGCRTRISNLLAVCPLPVLLIEEPGVIVDLSNSAEEELEQPRRRRGLLETLGSHELNDAVLRALDSLEPASLTVRLYAHGRRPFLATLFPFRGKLGSECLVFLKDVSAAVNFGELRSQFAATVSHELRTPLAGIRALVESLRDPEIENEDANRFLERLDQETGRLSQLIEEILFISSLESGAEILEGETELRSLANTVVEKLAPIAQKREVVVENDLPDGLVVPLRERMANIILANLVDNAIKYSGRGSRVEVTGGREANQVKLVVRDDGIGIDAEHLPHIFERFYRVDKSRSRRMGGTGLGLSIVKHIIESAGGEVTAQSQEGYGTEIKVTLPLGDAAS